MILAGYVFPHPPLIVPAVGRGEESAIQKTIFSYTQCAKNIAALKPQTIIVASPHAICYADYFHISAGGEAQGSFARFRAPQEKFFAEYDEPLVKKICEVCESQKISAGVLGERAESRELDHGTMVPLFFINQFFSEYKLVRVGLSGLSFEEHWKFGKAISFAANELGRRCVFIASGDLSHKLKAEGPYGFDEAGPAYDERVMGDLGRGDFFALKNYDEDFTQRAAQCGHKSFLIMGGALFAESENSSKTGGLQKGCDIFNASALSYEGPFGVGYGVCEYKRKE